jgi:hypothetical protein
MTQASPLKARRSLLAGLCLGLALLSAAPLAADDAPPSAPPPPALPPHVVARIYGPAGEVLAELAFEHLRPAIVSHVLADLEELSSAPMTILRGLIEEMLVAQEGRALGLAVSDEEVKAYVGKLDTKLRTASGGQKNIGQLRKDKGMTWEVFRGDLACCSRRRSPATPSISASCPRTTASA